MNSHDGLANIQELSLTEVDEVDGGLLWLIPVGIVLLLWSTPAN